MNKGIRGVLYLWGKSVALEPVFGEKNGPSAFEFDTPDVVVGLILLMQ